MAALCRCFAEHHAAGSVKPTDTGRIHIRNGALRDSAGEIRLHALSVLQILDGEGNTLQQARLFALHEDGFGTLRSSQCDFWREPHHGIPARFDAFDARKDGLHNFNRGELAAAIGRRQVTHTKKADIIRGHVAASAVAGWPAYLRRLQRGGVVGNGDLP